MQSWSDPKPREEYFEFLAKGPASLIQENDCKSIIVGSGRIGSLLYEAGNGDDLIIKRGEAIPDIPGPVYLCTRSDDLEELIQSCPENKKEDLVFMQNGMIEPLLKRYALWDEVTLANIYFALTKKGGDPIDGRTDMHPQGLTNATGKWATALSQRLEKADLTCNVVNKRDCRRSMLDKLIWISSVMLIGSVHGGIPVGEVEKFHKKELTEMVSEMGNMIRTTLAIAVFPNQVERLNAYSRVIPQFPTALKEFKWRNGFFYDFSMLARKNGFGDYTPMHTAYLEEGKERGLLSWP